MTASLRTPWSRGSSHVYLKAAVVAAIVALIWLPYQSTPYRNLEYTLAGVWCVASVGLNLLTGSNGQLSLATGAFLGIGAYSESLLITRYQVNYLGALLIAAAAGFVLGFALGIPASRLRGFYLVLLTLTTTVCLTPLLNRFGWLTGGVQGLVVKRIPAPEWTRLASDQWIYFVTLGCVGISLLIYRNILRGAVGRAIRAQGDNAVVAETLGIRLLTYRSLTFAVSSMLISVSGALYALVVGLLTPDAFGVILSVTILAGVVVGGTGTILGCIVAGIFVEFMPIVTGNVSQALSGVVYGGLLIAVLLAMPSGVVGSLARLFTYLRRLFGGQMQIDIESPS